MDDTVFSRRRALGLLGGGALVALVGCGADDDPPSEASSTVVSADPGAATTAAAGECSTITEETAGPFPGDGSNGPDVLAENGVVRADIRSSVGGGSATAEGVPLTFTLTLLDTGNGCGAMSGAAVYIWHCDREGRYSMYDDGVEAESYLRGVQPSGADGRVTFTSVFPGCYGGRWPHAHFAVYENVEAAVGGGTPLLTSQLALPQDACDAVYATSGYEGSVESLARLSLASDNVFADDGAVSQLATTTGSPSAGYTAELTVPV